MEHFTELFSREFWQNLYRISAEWVVTTVPTLLLIFVVFLVSRKVLSIIVNRLRAFILRKNQARHETPIESEKRINTLMDILKQGGRVVLWLVFIMILLREFGLDIGPLIASAGVVGLAIGFGAQELVRDIISGFFLLLENQVRTGDVAVINGTGGLVEKIELRTVSLRDFSGTVHIFQNGKINTLANMTKEWSAIVFDIGVAYKEDVEKVIAIIKETGEQMKKDPDWEPKIIADIEVFGVDKFADSAVIIKARIKTKPIEQWSVGREYRKRLKYAFDQSDIEIPFPHTTVYWGEAINPLKLSVQEQLSAN